MSNRYKGGVISATPPTTTGGESGTASGAWTLEQQMQAQAAGLWPAQPTGPWIEDCFSTYLYTGNGSTQTITNGIDLAGKGGLVWIKQRQAIYVHLLTDSTMSRGKRLDSSTTQPITDNAPNNVTSLNSNGFSLLDTASGIYGVNGSPGGANSGVDGLYVSWTFRKQPKFFDVVTYTGTGVIQNIPHNLGSVPGCILVKRITGAVANWAVYHRSQGATKVGTLNTTAGFVTNSTPWGNTEPTSTVFTVDEAATTNGTGTYVAYLFAHDAGGFGALGTDNVISCGTFSGSVEVNLGYEAQWVLIKDPSSGDWYIIDTMRGMSNSQSLFLRPNIDSVEGDAGAFIIPTATGFKNVGGGTYIYIAIRRGPMRTPTVGTSVFNLQNSTEPVSTPIFSAGTAPPDFILNFPRYNGVAGPFWLDRLRGNARSLTSATTAAETSPTAVIPPWFFNTGQRATIAAGAYYNNSGGSPLVQYSFIRAPSFFDEVCYAGTNSGGLSQTISHNLGVAPELIIFKKRGATSNWTVVTPPISSNNISLNLNAVSGTSYIQFVDTYGTSSITTASGYDTISENTTTYVAYLFATCAGVSKVGNYTGTGTTLQIDCGFTGGARFVLIKRTDSTGDWYVWDSARGIVSGNDPYLRLNSDAAEVTGTDYVDTYNAGFEISSTAPAAINASAGTYIFLAIA